MKHNLILHTTLTSASNVAEIETDTKNDLEINIKAPVDHATLAIGDLVVDAIRKLDNWDIERFALVLRFEYRDKAND